MAGDYRGNQDDLEVVHVEMPWRCPLGSLGTAARRRGTTIRTLSAHRHEFRVWLSATGHQGRRSHGAESPWVVPAFPAVPPA